MKIFTSRLCRNYVTGVTAVATVIWVHLLCLRHIRMFTRSEPVHKRTAGRQGNRDFRRAQGLLITARGPAVMVGTATVSMSAFTASELVLLCSSAGAGSVPAITAGSVLGALSGHLARRVLMAVRARLTAWKSSWRTLTMSVPARMTPSSKAS